MSPKIYITQGYESGIGLEVFLKSFQCLSEEQKEKLIFVGNPKYVSGLNISTLEIKPGNASETLSSLNLALENIKKGDILVTLPSSKDQFNGKLGHTEYLRNYYQKELGMLFLSPQAKVLLLSDHIPISKVSSQYSSDLISKKIKLVLEKFPEVSEVLLAGLNPHAGENGALGVEELNLGNIKGLPIPVKGPFPADTLMFKHESNRQLFVFAYHDQALTFFKKLYGLFGLNITTGLDFIRLSVDHGTAPDIFGKNCANYQGMNYLFDYVFNELLNEK